MADLCLDCAYNFRPCYIILINIFHLKRRRRLINNNYTRMVGRVPAAVINIGAGCIENLGPPVTLFLQRKAYKFFPAFWNSFCRYICSHIGCYRFIQHVHPGHAVSTPYCKFSRPALVIPSIINTYDLHSMLLARIRIGRQQCRHNGLPKYLFHNILPKLLMQYIIFAIIKK